MDQERSGLEIPSIDRFDEYARTLFADLRLSGRTPVAVVGSGMSVTYGGVSWATSVKLALEEAKRQLNCELNKTAKPSERNKTRLNRCLAAVQAMIASKYPTAPDKYLALDVAKEAMAVARSCAEERKATPGPAFTDFMQRLFASDAHFIVSTLKDRFFLEEGTAEKLFGKAKSEPDYIQGLACHIYRWKTLSDLAKGQANLVKFAAKIKPKLRVLQGNAKLILPIDRRSLICVFLLGRDEGDLRVKFKEFEQEFEQEFKRHGQAAYRTPPRPLIDPIRALYDELGIRRFITLNFDFELENAVMIDDLRTIKGRGYGFAKAIEEGHLTREQVVGAQPAGAAAPDTLGVTRRFSDGLAASSDVYTGTAVARLFEFALNSPDYRTQILHLHGRADVPETMLLTESDLNRIYRRNPQSRTTLEQALDVVLTGNAVLFAGIGLTEPEITRALRMLVSEGRATPANPAFALMAFDQGAFDDNDVAKKGGSDSWRHQMALFRQYGIHLIDAGHPRHGDDRGLPRHLRRLDRISDSLKDVSKELDSTRAGGLTAGLMKAQRDLQTTVLACRELPIVTKISIDGVAWQVLCDRLVAQPASLASPEIDLAIDYCGKLREKLYSFCAENEIKRLATETAQRFEATSLLAERPNKPLPRVRDRSTKFPLRPNQSVRHDVIATAGESNMQREARRILAQGSGARCFLAPLGWGKGQLSRCIRDELDAQSCTYVVVNCNFALEFESAIFQILRFAWTASASGRQSLSFPVTDRITKLNEAMAAGALEVNENQPPTIVLTGIERLIDSAGRPVTPEFEVVLRVLFDNVYGGRNWRVIIVGTPDCITFLERCGATATNIDVVAPDGSLTKHGLVGHVLMKARAHLDKAAPSDEALFRQLDASELSSSCAIVPNGARSVASSAVLKCLLERWHDIAIDRRHAPDEARAMAEFDKAILQSLAFIGQPVEIGVLEHLPKVTQAARADSLREHALSPMKMIQDSCNRLADFGLVLKIKPFPTGVRPEPAKQKQPRMDQRVALHRSVLAEIRDRFGVRSGDEMLSNSFALTLALSMPTDLVIAETDIHESLKQAVGHLRGAWKDAVLDSDVQGAFKTLRRSAGLNDAGATLDADKAWANEHIGRLERSVCMVAQPMQPRLRAAAGIVRGFFTAATLVTMIPERSTRDEWMFGEFEEHKRRIAKLMARIREVNNAKATARRLMKELKKHDLKFATSLSTINAALKKRALPSPLYSGELVWMLNELAVISLLQGSLYIAEQSFREADRALTRYKGTGARQSWRRLEINRALVRIERGYINQARISLESIHPLVRATKTVATWEDQLTLPLIDGYIGLCDFLGGHYQRADAKFTSVIEPLIKTDQQRALALFYWRTGELYLNMRRYPEAEAQFRLGLAAAEAGRQMDVVWRIRISKTKLPDVHSTQMAEAILREAQGYADVMDIPRIAMMVHARRANLKLELGDTQSAASFATQAMQVASSNGMVLNRISTRTLMGQILLRQGDPSGEFLLRRAIAHADRIGYQLHVDRAQEALLEIKSKAHQ